MRNIITKTSCPAQGVLYSSLTSVDYEDAYAFTVPGNSERIEEIYMKIFNVSPPAWVVYAIRVIFLVLSYLVLFLFG